tara:strand:+ start:69 stop:242 length:174 start_codon:yes stop_codon:yes gene_type:complete
MLKKKTVIWITCIMSVLVTLVIELGNSVTLMALVWMIPVLGAFTYMLMMQDWKKDNE